MSKVVPGSVENVTEKAPGSWEVGSATNDSCSQNETQNLGRTAHGQDEPPSPGSTHHTDPIKTKMVKILRKTADETPEQRVLRKEQERKIIKKKEVRSSRSRREERSRRESQVEKKDEDDETIEQEVISIPAGEWSALSDAMLLSRKYFFLKVVREDNDAGVHDMMGHFKQIVKKSQGSKASPFNGHKWYERFLITLGNLENTRECDIMIKCKVPLEEVKFEEAQAMAEGLQICMKKTWNAEKALKMWYDFYPQMQPMKEVIWFKVVTRIMINALICEFRYSPLVFKLMLLLLVFMVSFGQQSQDERCSSYFSCTYLGNAEAQQQADWDNNNND